MNTKYGFTLVEMLFVVIIAGAVLAMSIPAYKRTQERARYSAATGQLANIGGAIQGLNRDLAMLGVNGTFPFNANEYKITVPDSDPIAESQTLKESLDNADDVDRVYLGALFQQNKYLQKNIAFKDGYEFWAVRSGNSVCNESSDSKCDTANVMVCMCKPTYNADDCFYGAKYFRDGTVERIRGENCKSTN